VYEVIGGVSSPGKKAVKPLNPEEKGYTMGNNSVVELRNPESKFRDHLTEILQAGCQRIISEALAAELEGFLEYYQELRDDRGKQRVVRNGYLPEREVQTGVGAVPVKVPRTRDREPGDSAIRFRSGLLPPYVRRTRSIEALLPWLYLKGISSGDFSEALAALLGKDAVGLSPNTIGRLKAQWQGELEAWQQRDMVGKRYIYWWVDGIYCTVRMEEKQCLLVIIGVTEEGKKELVALEDGFRESTLSWKGALRDLQKRGLVTGPKLAIGDGALGFWNALGELYPETQWQRCWVHKTVNVLNCLPKSLQPKAKQQLQAIWMAPGMEEAEKDFDCFIEHYGAKYPKATDCLAKDREVLLTFYNFPAEHWKHIRTTNPIESTFATVRLRTNKVKSCFSSRTVVTMAFKLCRCAEKRWQKIKGVDKLAKVLAGVKFVDGEERVAA
jgi:putative transposase